MSTVQGFIKRAQAAELSWPLPEDLDDTKLDRLLFMKRPEIADKPHPDWGAVHHEPGRKGVTLSLFWQEYVCSVTPKFRQTSWSVLP
ncbi:MAG: transposase [Desulfovibrionaceae bacterium]|nr:transposase [Desulfovibrionaceae bacterium]MBF0515155.1 transposase [Desulfovibrionaceae bacterium]